MSLSKLLTLAKASGCRPDIGGGSWRSRDLKWSSFGSIKQADTSGNRSLEPALQAEISAPAQHCSMMN